jgi:putative endonuclease
LTRPARTFKLAPSSPSGETIMPGSFTERGRHAETMAAAFLALRGYTLLERNVRTSRLEIDLVVRQGTVLAFVEVKYRERPVLGGAAGAVTIAKRRDVETAAVGYVTRRDIRGVRIRFDVVTVEAEPPGTVMLRHLPGAFQATGRYRL